MLKELGFGKPSLYEWYGLNNGDWIIARSEIHTTKKLPAYTVAELGEMLAQLGEEEIESIYLNGQWTMSRGIETIPSLVKYIWHPTEAQARAALLIHLLEQEQQ